jgi:hypothetical protein
MNRSFFYSYYFLRNTITRAINDKTTATIDKIIGRELDLSVAVVLATSVFASSFAVTIGLSNPKTRDKRIGRVIPRQTTVKMIAIFIHL